MRHFSQLVLKGTLCILAATCADAMASRVPAGVASVNAPPSGSALALPSGDATHQPNDKADIKLAAAVRRAILQDKTLSWRAHNITLVAANGVVTLRGNVKSDAERSAVESLVRSVSGVSDVHNELRMKNH
jgi:Predicted periplasmic or secreted lipoprotein